MTGNSSQDEIEKFTKLSERWWDKEGPLKTLHDINPTRIDWLSQHYATFNDIKGLDVGCGGGILTESLAKLGAHMSGIEPATEVCRVAKSHAKEASLNIDYHNELIEDFEPENLFDAIFCLEMLEHVPDFNQIIYHAKRLLKPGGMLFLSTINRTTKAYVGAIIVAEYVLNLLEKQTHDYQKFIKPSELAESLRRHNFEIIDMKGLRYNPLTRSSILCQNLDMNYLVAARA